MGNWVCLERDPMSGPSPHLDKYFSVFKEVSQGPACALQVSLGEKVGGLMFKKGQEQRALLQEVRSLSKQIAATMEEAWTPMRDIIRESFDYHDEDKDGLLNEAEGHALFQHYVERFWPCMRDVTAKMMEQVKAQGLERLAQSDSTSTSYFDREIKKNFAKRIDSQKEAAIKAFKDKWDSYKATKAEKDKAAFAVLDMHGDRMLRKEDVTEGLNPSTEKFIDYMEVLGLYTEKEVAQQRNGRKIQEKLRNDDLADDELIPKIN